MILTTTNKVEDKEVASYLGIVTGITFTGNYGTKGMALKDVFNSKKYYQNYEKGLEEAKESAFQKLRQNAENQQASAIVGISVDIEMMANTGIMMVSVVGTAVKFK